MSPRADIWFLSPLCLTVPPQIVNISSDITVNEGSSVTLMCLAFGRPEPTVTWRHLSGKGESPAGPSGSEEGSHLVLMEHTVFPNEGVSVSQRRLVSETDRGVTIPLFCPRWEGEDAL